jgi:hypothetical protein
VVDHLLEADRLVHPDLGLGPGLHLTRRLDTVEQPEGVPHTGLVRFVGRNPDLDQLDQVVEPVGVLQRLEGLPHPEMVVLLGLVLDYLLLTLFVSFQGLFDSV